MRRAALLALIACSLAAVPGVSLVDAQDAIRLTTTEHPALPTDASAYWLAPDTPQAADTPQRRLARAAALVGDGDFDAGLRLMTGVTLDATPLANYAHYYRGLSLLGLERADDAQAALDQVDDEAAGYLHEAVSLALADTALARDDADEAADILDDLRGEILTGPEEVLLRLARAEAAAGDRDDALKAYRRLRYEFPLSSQAADAQKEFAHIDTGEIRTEDVELELGRAERLFGARRWADARTVFATLARLASGDTRELVALRLAECDYHLKRYRAAGDALRPLLTSRSHEAEARYFHLSATRGLGAEDTYIKLARGLVADHPDSPWAEETLNDLASHYIRLDEDARADTILRELAAKFPRGRYAERAAWKIGWWAYKTGDFAEAAQRFEAAAAAFPRADYRPSWLYWAARARDRMGDRALANARYRLVASDYLNLYYGRLASAILEERREPPVRPIVLLEPVAPTRTPSVPNEPVIRALASAGLYDAALGEVRYAQRAWGDSPVLQATVAWIRHHRGLQQNARERFADVRGAITIMRRTYPQFMAAGGEHLPPDVLRIIFPIDYWPLIKKYSDAHGLDPYLMTALVAQESTFTPDVRSSANAVGLMQLIPPTARRVASRLGIRRFSTSLLTEPETNVRLGMRYFKDLMEEFGAAHYALAGYNAGPHRVRRWKAERPGFAQDEFIDDIPYAETQNYVKRILGTAEDYRRLYGGGVLSTTPPARPD